MQPGPSAKLLDLLARHELATADQVARMAPRVRKLAGELPEFDSVWIDALAQAGLLTPYQAAQINVGRGESLARGGYVVLHPIASPYYAACFAARARGDGRIVRLYVVQAQSSPSATSAGIAEWLERSKLLPATVTGRVEDAGCSGADTWAACRPVAGVTAADWMVENGRFPPVAVLHIARELARQLAELDRAGLVHGDIGASGLLLNEAGHVAAPLPGFRGIVRPSEGYSFNDLAVESYDCLAPERVADGAPPTRASDLYACGCLWWHLLTGRAPFAGGNALAKLKAVHAAKATPVKQLAPDTPDALARAIEACLARDPAARPSSYAELAAILGPATRNGAVLVARCVRCPISAWRVRADHAKDARASKVPIAALATAAILLLLIGLWPIWRSSADREPTVAQKQRVAAATAKQPSATSAPPATSPPSTIEPKSQPVQLASATTAPSGPPDMLLDTGAPLTIPKLELKRGQRVRGRGGKRATLVLSDQPLEIVAEDGVFEGIDFVWEKLPRGTEQASLSVRAQSLEFRDCSFRGVASRLQPAMVWAGQERPPIPGYELTFVSCVVQGFAAAIDFRATGNLAIEAHNSLLVDSGPLARISHATKAAESISISLDRVTLRAGGSVAEYRYFRGDNQPGRTSITAADCVIDTTAALLTFVGPQQPTAFLSATSWAGEGSFIGADTTVAAWRSGSGSCQELPEEDLEFGGVARCDLEFAGAPQGGPDASRLKRWQGPLRSADPPGADVSVLPVPVTLGARAADERGTSAARQ